MASRTFVFVGYSLRDSDFRLIWEEIIQSLGQFRRLAFVVDPEEKDEKTAFWKTNGLRHIRMTDVMFARSIHAKLVADGHLPSEKLINFFATERQRTERLHFALKHDESDVAFSSAMYQDGFCLWIL